MMKAYTKKTTKITPLIKRRMELNLSMTEIARYVGVSPQLMTNWFNIKYVPGDKYIEKLAEILQVTPKWIRSLYANGGKKQGTYSNFWTEKRNSAGVTNTDIREYLKLSKDTTTIAKYFTGEIMPKDDTIKAICNMFDVDFATGKAEFEKINADYHNKPQKTAEVANTVVPSVTVAPVVVPETTTKKKSETIKPDINDDVIKCIYGEVSYDEFFTIKDLIDSNTGDERLLELIYGKVDCDIFNKVWDIVNHAQVKENY